MRGQNQRKEYQESFSSFVQFLLPKAIKGSSGSSSMKLKLLQKRFSYQSSGITAMGGSYCDSMIVSPGPSSSIFISSSSVDLVPINPFPISSRILSFLGSLSCFTPLSPLPLLSFTKVLNKPIFYQIFQQKLNPYSSASLNWQQQSSSDFLEIPTILAASCRLILLLCLSNVLWIYLHCFTYSKTSLILLSLFLSLLVSSDALEETWLSTSSSIAPTYLSPYLIMMTGEQRTPRMIGTSGFRGTYLLIYGSQILNCMGFTISFFCFQMPMMCLMSMSQESACSETSRFQVLLLDSCQKTKVFATRLSIDFNNVYKIIQEVMWFLFILLEMLGKCCGKGKKRDAAWQWKGITVENIDGEGWAECQKKA